jgi:hypothetical protein
MKVIWKYPLITSDEQVISIPKDAKILTVQIQDDVPTIWAIVDPLKPKEDKVIIIRGTGLQYQDQDWDGLNYIGSYQYQFYNGKFVGHVFVRDNNK